MVLINVFVIYLLNLNLFFNVFIYCDNICDMKVIDSCYIFDISKLGYSDAEDSCYKKNGSLVNLDNDSEMKALTDYMVDHSIETAFIGLTDGTQRGTFRWSNDKVLTDLGLIINRGWSEKNCETCILLSSDGKWIRSSCKIPNQYICEVKPGTIQSAPLRTWTEWVSLEDPSKGDQILTVENIKKKFPFVCPTPNQVECKVVGTNVLSNNTDDVFQMPCSKNGLICLNSEQKKTSRCQYYQLRFLCPIDIDECKEPGLSDCDKNAQCLNTYGSYKCVCKPGFSGDGKNCYKTIQCVAWGDPHYISFDQVVHHFMGICSYRLAETCFRNQTMAQKLNAFNITSANEYRGNNMKVSYTKSVTLQIGKLSIQLGKNNQLLIDGAVVSPPQTRILDDIEINMILATKGIRIQTSFGLDILYDGESRVIVSVPKIYANQMCGMCGDMNGNKSDEWALSDGTQSNDGNIWGNSWIAPVQDDKNCVNLNYSLPQNLCDNDIGEIVKRKCDVLKDQNGPFKPCHKLIDPETIYPSCFFDLCSDPESKLLMCASFNMYAEKCTEQGILLDWRSSTGCTVTCGANEHYQENTSGCQASCNEPDAEVNCHLRDTSGCVCNDGYLRSGTVCKLKEQCGCYDANNNYRVVGDVWFTDFCSTKNKCTGTNTIIVDPNVQCHQHGECFNMSHNGESECRCKKGFVGQADNCTDVDECSRGNFVCSSDGECVNSLGGYKCQCKTGFTGNGTICTDINECSAGKADCSHYATCYNTRGSYQCICQNGYEGNGRICNEIKKTDSDFGLNDCSFHQDETCHPLAECTDLSTGGFTCTCIEGTRGDGLKGPSNSGCVYEPCPSGYTAYQGYCYRYFTTLDNSTMNEKKCISDGGHLATFVNDFEQSFISSQLEIFQVNSPLYVGYSAVIFKDIFMPIDFSFPPTNNWATGHPKSGLSCVVILPFNDTDRFKYKAVSCSEKYGAICKFPSSPRRCPDGWREVGNKCVTLFKTLYNVTEAILQCGIFGGDLATIRSKNESDQITKRLLKLEEGKFWFGFNKNLLQRSSKAQWWNISDVKFKNFDPSSKGSIGMPPDIECYQILPSGKWVGAICNDSATGFLCERPQNVIFQCPPPSQYFNGKCYKITEIQTKIDSEKICSSAGGELISISTFGEQTIMENLLKSLNRWNSYWIGLEADATINSLYSWSDNTTFEYKNWNLKDSDTTKDAKCVIADSSNGYSLPWSKTQCDLKFPGICEYVNTPCSTSKDCHVNGQCSYGQCQCKEGFKGDGLRNCTNINECLSQINPCKTNEACQDTEGSFTCNCIPNFVRLNDGICQSKSSCYGDADCAKNGKCFQNTCSCNLGFEGDGKLRCDDVNECLNFNLNKCNGNATCKNENGYYTCTCNNGFQGNGKDCQLTPKTCDEYLQKNLGAKSGTYQIDPDGTGPFLPIDVTCEMRNDIGITIIHHDREDAKEIVGVENLSENRTITYTISFAYAVAIVKQSNFCYQDMKFVCRKSLNIFESTTYFDVNGKPHKKWGSSSTENKCGCGELKLCEDPMRTCFCDGKSDSEKNDQGRIIDKSILPLTGILTGGKKSSKSGSITIGPLICSSLQINIPQNCHDAKKNYGVKENTIMWIDPDLNGPLKPFPVFCDVQTKSFGVTIVSHDQMVESKQRTHKYTFPGPLLSPLNIQSNICLKYQVDNDALLQLIKDSGGCIQEVQYECKKGAELLNQKAYLQTLDGKNLDYFGSGLNGKCPCGVYGSCTDKSANCNCDGKNAGLDFGFIYKKEDLPIKCFVDKNKLPGYSTISIGALMCGPGPFGMEPTCNEWVKRGYTANYTYLIDPDGGNVENNPKNKDAFLADCVMIPSPTYGITIFKTNEGTPNCTNQIDKLCQVPVTYQVTADQIGSVTRRSAYCFQKVKYTCKKMSLLKPYTGKRNPYAFWKMYGIKNQDANYSYFSGNGINEATCQCGLDKTCDTCLCDMDAKDTKYDEGYLQNKTHLPVGEVWIGQDPKISGLISQIEIGDLECYDLFPTCEKAYYFELTTELNNFDQDYYTVDPDGPLGEEPIIVYCSGKTTKVLLDQKEIQIDDANKTNIGPKAQCFNMQYHESPSFKQLKKLTSLSNFCRQYLSLTCMATPLTKYVEWYDVDGISRPGWAGNSDGKKCACGEVNSCEGGENFSCNCDSMSTSLTYDHGLLVNKDILPVSKICLGLTENSPQSSVKRKITIKISELYCSASQDGIYKDCQEMRERQRQDEFRKSNPQSEAWIIDPDNDGPLKPFTVYCDMKVELPVGITVIKLQPNPSICTNSTMTKNKASINIDYLSANKNQIQILTEISSYCEQEVSYDCQGAHIFDGKEYGVYDNAGKYFEYWLGPNDKNSCTNKTCHCGASDENMRSDSGKFTNKTRLPLSKILASAINGQRKLCVRELKCYNLPRTCEEYGSRLSPDRGNGDNNWAIDPDQAGGEDYIGVLCKTIDKIVVTETLQIPNPLIINGSGPSNRTAVPYKFTIMNQIRLLMEISKFCSQRVDYLCLQTGTLNNNGPKLFSFNGNPLTVWAGADYYNKTQGCACDLLGICPKDNQCRCDALPNTSQYEGGLFTNKNILPITEIGYKIDQTFEAKIYPLDCGSNYFGLPKDCSEVTQTFSQPIEVLIKPDGASEPFLVRCRMMSMKGKADVKVTEVLTKPYKEPNAVYYPSVVIPDIKVLIEKSVYCIQPMKVSCQGIMLSSFFTWTDGSYKERSDFGTNNPNRFCPCGISNGCAGIPGESRESMKSRKCSCDTPNYNVNLADSIVISDKTLLPISSVSFRLQPNSSSINRVKVGSLMCSDRKFEFDECENDFHDCDSHAKCINTNDGHTCSCVEGWQGLGGNEMYSNGRSCIDDNECALLKCPAQSDCTNTPGSFICTCHKGYQKVAPTVCKDIDECKQNSSICDKNAKCINTEGSYICSCNPGFRGSGEIGDCEAIATCGCWGDPHCLSFDGKWFHYQGRCKYTMVRDQCEKGLPKKSSLPTFEIIMKNWDQNQNSNEMVSWAKEMTIKFKNYTIVMKLGSILVVNGQKTNVPYNPKLSDGTPVGFEASYYGYNLLLRFSNGVEVKWDGISRVDMTIPSKMQSKVCGLCGNYNLNPYDDWTVGPQCIKAGQITDLLNLFGDSWRNNDPIDTDSACPKETCLETPNEKECSPEINTKAKLSCDKLRQIFSTCESVMKQYNRSIDDYITSCIYDQCHSSGDLTKVLCKTAESLAEKCFNEYKVTVVFRSDNFCNWKCPENSEYSTCASPCPKSCSNYMDDMMCMTLCVEGCVCKIGYVMENGKCVKPDTCGCKMPDGTYYLQGQKWTNKNCSETCKCNRQSVQLECSKITCSEDAFCDFKDDDYGCHCKNGFMGNGIQCEDVNECLTKPCDSNALCINTNGSYVCKCNEGYEGNGKTCTNINECSPTSPCNNATEECLDKVPGYDCRCREGFVKNLTTGECDDKNECSDTGNLCDRVSTFCNNTFGSYRCECKQGFRPNPEPSFVCKDVNECNVVHECDKKYAKCTNTPGAYFCTCNDGFEGDGRNCTDIDECKSSQVCKLPGTKCVNSPGSYDCICLNGHEKCDGTNPCDFVQCNSTLEICRVGECVCQQGYSRNSTTGQCEDVDECKTKMDDCASKKANCSNIDGSFECQCLYGYQKSNTNGSCENVDECKENLYRCGQYAKCIDTDGGYYCECQTGFTGHCDECRDIDECSSTLNLCDKDRAICQNSIGSYTCRCREHYSGDGKTCIDINECQLGLHNCTNLNQVCANTDGGFKCSCVSGYVMNENSLCEDENECLYANNGCDENADCINTQGAFICNCRYGYVGSGHKCEPKAGYENCGKILCSENSKCVNGTCKCKSGFKSVNNECININECLNQTTCDINAYCLDIPGSFKCNCKDEYVGNGYNCFKKSTEIDICKTESYCIDGDCYDGECHCPQGFVLRGSKCNDERCIDGCPSNSICSTSSGSVVCSCSLGTSWSSSGCIDINECSNHYDDCQDYSNCVNVYGWYECKCAPGYLDVFGDGKICKYVGPSECKVKCPVGQYCKDGKCSCLPGLNSTQSGKGLTCSKVTESCLPGTCPPDSTCEERLFGYLCHCKSGYEGMGKQSCLDIDECSRNLHNCVANENCLNSPGSFQCICKTGLVRNEISGLCESENKCKCGPFGLCNKDGKCICKQGYATNTNGICEDVNECEIQSPCHVLAKCTNTPGSYSCECPENYYGNASIKCIEDKCKTKSIQCQLDEECIQSLFGSVCHKKTCISTELLIDGECISITKACEAVHCGKNAVCRIENGRTNCFCDSGYFGDGESCVNINECSNGEVSCPRNSRCQDKDGSFYCACIPGYERPEKASKSDACEDIDECKINKSCAANAICTNTIGSFQCSCKTGYFGEGRYVCEIDSKCKRFNGCHKYASCVVNPKELLYECQCDPGYSGNGVQSCIKENACFDNGKPICHPNATCNQINSTYQCTCPSGFEGDGYNFCSDIDECLNPDTHNCSVLEKCINTNGKYVCMCGEGATVTNNICTDINECNGESSNNCSENSICHNTQGSYNCQCMDGYSGDGMSCKDIDECKLGVANCSQNALCLNKPGTFACECQAGTIGNGTTCEDEDECQKPRGSLGAAECDENAICTNKKPGYTCQCKSDYVGTGWFCIKESPCNKPNVCNVNETCTLSDDYSKPICECKPDFQLEKDQCVPKEECNNGNHKCDKQTSNCIQLERGYKCECKPGFKMVGNVCEDKNECDPKSPDFAAQRCGMTGGGCLNTPGGFLCTCKNQRTDPKRTYCIPIDRCAQKLDSCNRDLEICISNKDYSYTCKCIEGFEKVNNTCVDIDECRLKMDLCKDNSTCSNTLGSYICTCPNNLKLSTSKRSCIDRNECIENPNICGPYGKCINTEGSHQCTCITGFQWNGTICEDIDECVNNNHPCHSFAECSNVPGSCTCKCKPGYIGDGKYQCSEIDSCPPKEIIKCPKGSYCNYIDNVTHCNCKNGYNTGHSSKCVGDICYNDCDDINECLTNKSVCHELAKCSNKDGSYVCTCPSYLNGDGKIKCEDQNECALNLHICNLTTSFCENLDNTQNVLAPFQCNCFNGYTKLPGTEICVNKNECINPTENDCPENSKCFDTDGSFQCYCLDGFKLLPSFKCVDIDECLENLDNCSINSVCQNTPGGYDCQCNSGFHTSNTSREICDDIDECQNPTSCSKNPNSICVNNPGSFECVCPTGTSLQGGSCLDTNECLIPNVCGLNGICINKPGGFNCTCEKHMKQLANGDCESINECQENIHRCQQINGDSSKCFDLPTGYGCSCPDGFTNNPLSPEFCEDVNECQSNTHNCTAANSDCSNLYGSFDCICKPGYLKNNLGQCYDIDECEVSKKKNLDICNSGKCINTQGSYMCQCPPGFSNEGRTCSDIDECSLDSVSALAGNCDTINGKCVNTKGSYSCICNKGFKLNEQTAKCQDINECSFPNICENGLCLNSPGSFECICNNTFSFVNGKCIDKNECIEQPELCGPQTAGVCVNKVGSYQCKCNVGYENSGGKLTQPCQQINECSRFNIDCLNGQCVDRSEGYECICKDGYKEDEIGICRNINECQMENSCHYLANCIDTDGSYSCACKPGFKGDGKISCKEICGADTCPPGQICKVVNSYQFECSCECQEEKCTESGPICDSHGVTYLTVKNMYETSCKLNVSTEIEYYHDCKTSCDEVICPGMEICSMSNGRPVCLCPQCTEEDLNSGFVCASNGIEFEDVCQLKNWICHAKSSISVSYKGFCHRPIDCEISGWTSWSACSRTCGIGKYFRERKVIKLAVYNGQCDDNLIEVQQCFNGPCPGDACEKITCSPGSFCEGGKCICPDCSEQETSDPVCGKVADKQSGTYRTFCTLIHNACMLNASYTYLHKGECGDHVPAEPKICSMVTDFKTVKMTDNCTSVEPVRTNLCSGGCGKNPNYCCRALTNRTLRVKFKCPDNTFVYREVLSVSSCQCKLEETTTPTKH